MHRVEFELVNKLDEPPRTFDEEREDYLRRIVRAGALVEDEVWDDLSDDAQAWVNLGIESINNKENPYDFEEYFEGKIKTPEDDSALLSSEEAAQAVQEEKKRAPDKRFDHKYRKRRRPGRKPTKNPQGAGQRAKELFLQHPDTPIDELLAMLIREGHQMSRSTLVSTRAEFRNSLKVLVNLGYIDKEKHYFGFPVDED